MMTRLAAVDLFVWHESLDGGSPGIDVLILPAGGSYSYLPCLGGSLFKSLPCMLEKYIQDRSLRNAHPCKITHRQVLHFWHCPVF